MKKILPFLLLITGLVKADIIETWSCKDRFVPNDTLVAANVHKDRKTGSIKVAGIGHQTEFQINGFERRWDFDSYYSFIIRPNGRGSYYDFSSIKGGEKIEPSIIMDCKKIEPSYFEKIERKKEKEIGANYFN